MSTFSPFFLFFCFLLSCNISLHVEDFTLTTSLYIFYILSSFIRVVGLRVILIHSFLIICLIKFTVILEMRIVSNCIFFNIIFLIIFFRYLKVFCDQFTVHIFQPHFYSNPNCQVRRFNNLIDRIVDDNIKFMLFCKKM